MLNIFPKLYPDELFYGWCIRYHVFSGNRDMGTTMLELFGERYCKLSTWFPVNLEVLIAQLPAELGITSEYIINNHTIFPFLKVFIGNENANNIIARIKYKTGKHIMNVCGISAQHVFDINTLKICKQCYIEDINSYGEAYIHRNHQIPGNPICAKHLQRLQEIKIHTKINMNQVININNYNIDNCVTNKEVSKDQLELSLEIDKILSGKFLNLNLEIIKEKYKKKIKEKTYVSKSQIDQTQLSRDFLNYYTPQFLREMNSHFEVNGNLRTSWLRRITIGYRNEYAIRHMLLIKFLFGGMEGLNSYNGNENPFGEGPWPCLNPAASHYLEDVISECSFIKSGRIKRGVFKCSCGFIYTRNVGSNKYKRNKVSQYGYVWEQKLMELYSNSVYPIRNLAKVMNCTTSTIYFHINKLRNSYLTNLSGNDKGNNNQTRINEDTESTLEQYKHKVREYILENRYETRTGIRRSLGKEYKYVYKHDKEWMESILPKSHQSNPMYFTDWKAKDDHILFLVMEAVKKIINSNKFVRVTITEISRDINYITLSKKHTLDKLPRTKEYLEKNLETLEDFHKRKIKKLIDQLVIEGVNITKDAVRKKLFLKKDHYNKMKSFIEEIINEAIKKSNICNKKKVEKFKL